MPFHVALEDVLRQGEDGTLVVAVRGDAPQRVVLNGEYYYLRLQAKDHAWYSNQPLPKSLRRAQSWRS